MTKPEYCPSCGQSMRNADYTLPWEDDDNPCGYWTCPYCRYEVLDDDGDDDD